MVAAVLEEAAGVARRRRVEGSAHRLHECLAGARIGLAQQPLDLPTSARVRADSAPEAPVAMATRSLRLSSSRSCIALSPFSESPYEELTSSPNEDDAFGKASTSGTYNLWVTNASFSVIRRTTGLKRESARSATERTAAAEG